MPKAITAEMREKIIRHKLNNKHENDIAYWLFISPSTVTKIWARYKKTSSLQNSYSNCGRSTVISVAQIVQIKAALAKNPDITLMELIKKFNLPITESGLSRLFKKLGLTCKKGSLCRKRGNVKKSV